MKGGAEGLDLLHEIVNQPLPRDHGEAGNVVDGLFGIELGALPAGLGQDVDKMGLDVQQAQLEHGEETGGASAHDDDVCLDDLAHDVPFRCAAGVSPPS